MIVDHNLLARIPYVIRCTFILTPIRLPTTLRGYTSPECSVNCLCLRCRLLGLIYQSRKGGGCLQVHSRAVVLTFLLMFLYLGRCQGGGGCFMSGGLLSCLLVYVPKSVSLAWFPCAMILLPSVLALSAFSR